MFGLTMMIEELWKITNYLWDWLCNLWSFVPSIMLMSNSMKNRWIWRERERERQREREKDREREREKYTVAGQKHSDNREGTRLETTYHRINCIFLHHLVHSITHYGRKGYVLAAALTDVQAGIWDKLSWFDFQVVADVIQSTEHALNFHSCRHSLSL